MISFAGASYTPRGIGPVKASAQWTGAVHHRLCGMCHAPRGKDMESRSPHPSAAYAKTPETLTWRPLTPADAQAAADLLNAIGTVDKIGEYYTAEDIRQELVGPLRRPGAREPRRPRRRRDGRLHQGQCIWRP